MRYKPDQDTTMQHDKIQPNTTQHNTIPMQHNIMENKTGMHYNSRQCDTTRYKAIQHHTIQHNAMQYHTMQRIQLKLDNIT